MKKNVKKKTATDLIEEMFKRLGLKAKYVEKSGCSAVLFNDDEVDLDYLIKK